jgi:hypothetical protein
VAARTEVRSVNLQQFERARLAMFAHDEAAHTGSLDAMKAVCYIMRNRAKAGWHDGTLLSVIEAAAESAGNDQGTDRKVMSASDRNFQLLLQSIDDIYYGQAEDAVKNVVSETQEPGGAKRRPACLYYQFANRPPRPWFVENIVRDPKNHPRRASFGLMFLFE